MSLVNYYKTFLKSFYQKIIPLIYQNNLKKLEFFLDFASVSDQYIRQRL